MTFDRYAIYWTPPPHSPLEAFAHSWFGAGPASSDNGNAHKALFGLSPELARKAIERPRRYQLHATIKAPFALAPGETENTLMDTLERFCAKRRRPVAGPLGLHRFPRYLALVPVERRAELDWLAAECVTHFDRFRAPLTDDDRARRSRPMSEQERQNLEEFGYPEIFSRFFFHITLAGPLTEDELTLITDALAAQLEPFSQPDFVMDGLSLLGDPGAGALFEPLAQFPFMR